jgi:hypothetical protein
MSVSNLLVYPPASPSPLASGSTLAEVIRRKEDRTLRQQLSSPLRVAEDSGEGEGEEGVEAERQRIERRMSELESEYSDLQKRLWSLP